MKKFLKLRKTIEKYLDILDKKWEKEFKPQIVRIDKPPEYLENRIVYCANCNHCAANESRRFTNSTLWRYQGRLVCSVCCSDNWEFPITVRPKIDLHIKEKVCRPSGKTC